MPRLRLLLHEVIAIADDGAAKKAAYRWLAYARSGLYEQWQKLPDGHHLKEAYRDDVQTWDDQDIALARAESQHVRCARIDADEEGLLADE